MKKLLLFLVLFLCFPCILLSSDYNLETQTSVPDSAKFEIITGSLAVKQTYLLNKYTGETWVLVVDSNNNYSWEEIDTERNEDDYVPENYTGPVYQITLSGIAVKCTYLLNTVTGATWTLYKDPDTDLYYWGVVSLP